MSALERLSISIERPLLKKLEGLLRKSRYANRSEFFRDLIRDRLVEEEWQGGEEALGTISLVYDHRARRLGERLTDLQHHHHHRVLATTHVHLDERLCAEMIMVRGRAEDIRHLADHMRREKGVLHLSLSMGSTGKKLA